MKNTRIRTSLSQAQRERRERLDRRLKRLNAKAVDLVPPERGWINAIRRALGIPSAVLAERLDVSQPRIIALERAEADGSIRLQTLRRAAEALGCRVVYAVVPVTSLDDIVDRQSRKVAAALFDPVSRTMTLEAQGLNEQERRRVVDRTARDLVARNLRSIWRAK